jgi:protein arginine phosphatase
MAEALLKSRVEALGKSVRVNSAGLLRGGMRPPVELEEVLARRGLEIGGHVSQQLEKSSLERADLVLGMERVHVREAVVLAPETWQRAFTLKEFVRRATAIPERGFAEPWESWLARIQEGRERIGLLGESSRDDIADPFGRSAGDYEASANEIDGLLARLVDQVWPKAR